MDSTNTLPQIAPSQAEKEVTANENFAAASPSMIFARNAVTSAALTWGYLGGRWNGTLVANGTITLNPGSTNYLVADRLTGQVMLQDGSPDLWADTDNFAHLYVVVTSAIAVTGYEDHRAGPLGLFGSAGGAGGIATTASEVSVLDLGGNFGSPSNVEAALAELADDINSLPADALVVQLACSDLATALAAGTGKAYVRVPQAMTLTEVRAALFVAQASGSIFTVDVNVSGSSVLSTKLTVDNTEKTSETAAAAAVISSATIADDAEVTIDIDQVGDGTAKGLIVTLIGTRT
jgi:hypothetical protein